MDRFWMKIAYWLPKNLVHCYFMRVVYNHSNNIRDGKGVAGTVDKWQEISDAWENI